MTVIRLKNGDLWVCAPVALDRPTKAAVDALGPVKHIVTPNTEHLTWARDWIQALSGGHKLSKWPRAHRTQARDRLRLRSRRGGASGLGWRV